MDRKGGEKDASHIIYSAPHKPIYEAYSINRAVERATKDHTFVDSAVKLMDGLKFPTFKNNIINHIKKLTNDLDTISLFESLDGYIEFHDKYHVRKSLEVNDPEKQKENQLTGETRQSPIGRNRNLSANQSIKDAEAVSGMQERRDHPEVTPTAISGLTCKKCGKSFRNQDDLVRHRRLEGRKAEEKKIREKSRTDRQQTVAINARKGKKVADVSNKKHQQHQQRLPDGEKTGNEDNKENKKDIVKETLKPITKVKSKEDKELQEQEVESTGGGMGAGGG